MDSSVDSADISFLRCKQQLLEPLSVLCKSIKQSKTVFVGTYLERRYVKRLRGYRDIVLVDKDEQELFKCLEEIQKISREHYGNSKWLGITCDMRDSVTQNYSLWVELNDVPLGKHWFQLKSIKVTDQSIQLHLKYLREIKQTNEQRSFNIDDYPEIDYRELLTLHNACETFKLAVIFVMSILTLTFHALWYVGDYSIKLARELSELVRALTPIIFGIIDFFTKCVGGLYWLIYMLWKGNSVPFPQPRPPTDMYKLQAQPYSNRRAITYRQSNDSFTRKQY